MKSLCFYCPHQSETKDHIIPKSLKGRSLLTKREKVKTVPACDLCNSTRGATSQEDFIRFMDFVKTKGDSLHSFTRKERKSLKREFFNSTGILIPKSLPSELGEGDEAKIL